LRTTDVDVIWSGGGNRSRREETRIGRQHVTPS
jgi:hypothetical protein